MVFFVKYTWSFILDSWMPTLSQFQLWSGVIFQTDVLICWNNHTDTLQTQLLNDVVNSMITGICNWCWGTKFFMLLLFYLINPFFPGLKCKLQVQGVQGMAKQGQDCQGLSTQVRRSTRLKFFSKGLLWGPALTWLSTDFSWRQELQNKFTIYSKIVQAIIKNAFCHCGLSLCPISAYWCPIIALTFNHNSSLLLPFVVCSFDEQSEESSHRLWRAARECKVAPPSFPWDLLLNSFVRVRDGDLQNLLYSLSSHGAQVKSLLSSKMNPKKKMKMEVLVLISLTMNSNLQLVHRRIFVLSFSKFSKNIGKQSLLRKMWDISAFEHLKFFLTRILSIGEVCGHDLHRLHLPLSHLPLFLLYDYILIFPLLLISTVYHTFLLLLNFSSGIDQCSHNSGDQLTPMPFPRLVQSPTSGKARYSVLRFCLDRTYHTLGVSFLSIFPSSLLIWWRLKIFSFIPTKLQHSQGFNDWLN